MNYREHVLQQLEPIKVYLQENPKETIAILAELKKSADHNVSISDIAQTIVRANETTYIESLSQELYLMIVDLSDDCIQIIRG
ncbi:hypothetical protein Bp8pC_189 [Bacillus phage Bp8p-C]|uniref:Uncharacterized protein n=2 Tax=Agatevirus Bp8pC TaxID=1910937 RepID=A0A0A0PQU4_9CAUD|nr:hypothetical protein AXJ20_gp159 [Bacillus phage Bp8p-C]YP_009784489.1 hypothetical protein QLX39_gp159 [Bacillus phage Bp8p-T]AHJ87619.1 hypothetical protein Bp8pC_189 [Bacillus phage Bp8p-C]AHJ87830.1 hypothetical protein Bp8pT_189 [Bacillus phage Bp8p-T]